MALKEAEGTRVSCKVLGLFVEQGVAQWRGGLAQRQGRSKGSKGRKRKQNGDACLSVLWSLWLHAQLHLCLLRLLSRLPCPTQSPRYEFLFFFSLQKKLALAYFPREFFCIAVFWGLGFRAVSSKRFMMLAGWLAGCMWGGDIVVQNSRGQRYGVRVNQR